MKNALQPQPARQSPKEAQDARFHAGHVTAPDLIHAKGISDTPIPDPSAFDRQKCNLILIEVGFCKDQACTI